MIFTCINDGSGEFGSIFLGIILLNSWPGTLKKKIIKNKKKNEINFV